MKRLSLIVALFLSAQTFAQGLDVKSIPEPITKAFTKGFSGTSNATWSQKGENYVVDFVQYKNKGQAIFNKKGKCVGGETTIPFTAMPSDAKKYILQQDKTCKSRTGKNIYKADGSHEYQFEVNGKMTTFSSLGKIK